jgi:hypothetical protein
MTLAEALDIDGTDRMRWLCSDENPNTVSREGYRRLVIELAEGRKLPGVELSGAAIPPAELMAKIQEAKKCQWLEKTPDCGCLWGKCKKYGGEKNARECIECVSSGANQ